MTYSLLKWNTIHRLISNLHTDPHTGHPSVHYTKVKCPHSTRLSAHHPPWRQSSENLGAPQTVTDVNTKTDGCVDTEEKITERSQSSNTAPLTPGTQHRPPCCCNQPPLCHRAHRQTQMCPLLSKCFYCLVQIVFTSWLLLLFSNSVFIDWVGQSFMIQHTMSNIVAQEHPVPLYRCLSWYNTDLTGGFFDDSRHLLYLTLPFWKATFRNIHVAQREIHFTASSGWCCY